MAGFTGYRRTIKLDFDYQEVKKGIPQVNQQMALLNAEFNKASASAAKNGSSMDKLKLSYDKLTNQVKLQGDKVNILRADLEKLTSSEVKNDKAIANKQIALKNAEAQLTRLKTAQDKANTAIQEANTGMGKLKTSLSDARQSMQDAGVDVDRLGQSFMAMSAAAAGIGVKSAQGFMDFESSMIKSRTIMDENAVSYDKMSDNVMALSTKYGKGAEDVAEANYQILSSNVKTADASKILEESLILAKTGFTETATAADVLTSIMNAYSMETEDANKIVDQLIMTQKLGKLTIDELGDTIGYVTSISGQCGVSINEVNAAIATMTRSGTKADAAITQTKQILAAVIAPTNEAAEAAKEMGIQFNAAALEQKGFNGFLDDVIKKTGGSAEKMALLFGNIRSLSGMLALGKEGGKEYAEVLAQIENSTGTANKALGDLNETTSGKFNKSINELKNNLIKAGDALSPLIDFISGLMSGLASVNPLITGAVGLLGALGLGVKGLMWAFGPLGQTLNFVATKLALIGTTSAVAGTTSATAGAAAGAGGSGFMMLGQGVSMSLGPLLLLIAIVAAVALVIGLCIGNMKGFQRGLKEATEDAGDAALNTAEQAERAQRSVQNAQNASNNAAKKMYSNSGKFATGTNFVPQDGYYRVNEYGQQETFLRRGDKVLNGAQTRQLENSTDMEETNSLLRTLCTEFKQMKTAYENQPRQMQRLAREGV